jgi:hypothetical protein
MSLLPRSAQLSRLLLVAAPLLALVQACGRSDPGDYLFGDDGPGNSPTSGSGGAGSGGASPGKGGAPSTGGGKAIGGSGVAGSGTGGIVGGGGSGTGGSSVGGMPIGGKSTGGASMGGAAGEPNDPGVTCGSEVCDAGTQRCCAGVAGFACVANNQACNGAVLDCTTANDCSGNEVCCLTFASSDSSASVCKDQCAGMGAGRERQLCSTDEECSGNRSCFMTVFGVSVCARLP